MHADKFQGHFFHQPSGKGYNGAQPTLEQLTQDFGADRGEDLLPTLNRELSYLYLVDHY